MSARQIVGPFSILVVAGLAGWASWKAEPVARTVTIFPQPSLLQSEQCSVFQVLNGETTTVKGRFKAQEIQLCGIKAPEKVLPPGVESQDNLRSLIAVADNQAKIIPMNTVRDGRTVAEVFATLPGSSEKLLQEEQLKAGLSRANEQAIWDCPNAEPVRSAQEIGQQVRAGVWARADQNPQAHRRQPQ